MKFNPRAWLRAALRFFKPTGRVHTCGICGGMLLIGIWHRCASAMVRGRIYRCLHCGEALTPGIGHRCADPAADRERLVKRNWSGGAGLQLRREVKEIGIARQLRDAEEVQAGFDLFRQLNTQRCEECFHAIDEWSESDWMVAAAGELGEAANLIKKRRRDESIAPGEVGRELADAVTYIDLVACRLGLNLGCILTEKFDEVSERVGFGFRFSPPAELAEPADPDPLLCDACGDTFEPKAGGAVCGGCEKIFCPTCTEVEMKPAGKCRSRCQACRVRIEADPAEPAGAKGADDV